MPIFVSRFSPNRVVGANLQQVRTPQNEATERNRADGAAESRRAEPTRGRNPGRSGRVEGAQEALPAATQFAERVADQVQPRRSRNTDSTVVPDGETTEGRGLNQGLRAGEGGVDTGVERGNQRPGIGRQEDPPDRLRRTPANPAREAALDRFAGIRGVMGRGNERGQGNARAAAVAPEANPQAAGGPENQAVVVRSDRDAAPQTQAPTAEEISRANTTPEIRENLQADTREIGQGLQRDATAQTRSNTRQAAENAGRNFEARREDVARESQSEVRELQTEQRRLERELQQTRQGIRSGRDAARRAQNPANEATVRTAAQIGTNLNILAG